MTRAEMHEKHTEEWSQLILEAQQSNLTIKGWCKEKGISEKTFYYWRRRLKSQNTPFPAKRTLSAASHPAPVFAELDMSIGREEHSSGCDNNHNTGSSSHPEFVIRFHECQIAVSQGFREEDLMKVLRVASHVQ